MLAVHMGCYYFGIKTRLCMAKQADSKYGQDGLIFDIKYMLAMPQ